MWASSTGGGGTLQLGRVLAASTQRSSGVPPPAPQPPPLSQLVRVCTPRPCPCSDEQEHVDSPVEVGRSKFLAVEAEDPFAEREGSGSSSVAGGKKGKKGKAATGLTDFSSVSLDSPKR